MADSDTPEVPERPELEVSGTGGLLLVREKGSSSAFLMLDPVAVVDLPDAKEE